MPTELTWTHYSEILSIKDQNKIDYYIKICIQQNLSTRELRNRIKNNEYERIDQETKNKLMKNLKKDDRIGDFIKHPIIIKINIIFKRCQKKY